MEEMENIIECRLVTTIVSSYHHTEQGTKSILSLINDRSRFSRYNFAYKGKSTKDHSAKLTACFRNCPSEYEHVRLLSKLVYPDNG